MYMYAPKSKHSYSIQLQKLFCHTKHFINAEPSTAIDTHARMKKKNLFIAQHVNYVRYLPQKEVISTVNNNARSEASFTLYQLQSSW